jgi:hypothetical protein
LSANHDGPTLPQTQFMQGNHANLNLDSNTYSNTNNLFKKDGRGGDSLGSSSRSPTQRVQLLSNPEQQQNSNTAILLP